MCKQHQNIYRIARESAGMTREQAAEKLNLSVKSIQAFEDGETRCCAYVLDMASVYDAPELPIQHLSKACQVGTVCLPEIEERDAPLSVMNLKKEMRDVEDLEREMVEATCNGTVTNVTKIRNRITSLVAAGLSFLHCSTKMLRKKKNTRAVTQVL